MKAAASGDRDLASRLASAAIQATLCERLSNGPVEGQVNRLKCIKRSMYGRAGMKLLRARVRHRG